MDLVVFMQIEYFFQPSEARHPLYMKLILPKCLDGQAGHEHNRVEAQCADPHIEERLVEQRYPSVSNGSTQIVMVGRMMHDMCCP